MGFWSSSPIRTAATAVAGRVDSGFQVIKVKESWEEATRACRDANGTLGSLASEEISRELVRQCKSFMRIAHTVCLQSAYSRAEADGWRLGSLNSARTDGRGWAAKTSLGRTGSPALLAPTLASLLR